MTTELTNETDAIAKSASQAAPNIISLSNSPSEEIIRGVGDSLWIIALRRLRQDRLTMVAIGVLLFLTVLSFSAPLFAAALQIDPDRVGTGEAFTPPFTGRHFLGTDDLGRDHFIRLLYAGQISLGIAFTAATLALILGIALGVYTGYYGGLVDDLMNWFISTLDSIPSLFLLILIFSLFRPGPPAMILVLGILGWTGTMRLVRGETFSLREREFVIAARSIGASPFRTMFVHIAPNIFSIIIVTMALNIGGLILTESALSFLGFGVKIPTASWGSMLTDVQTFYTKGPYLAVAPGLLIMITVLCLFIIGDGLRDAFDPKLKEKA
ncbi:MAG: ABC transporter permease [Chloroflexota bacterium]